MLAILANRTYRHLFAAQVIALVGTGLMTVALALLAYRLAGDNAGAVLGTALAIKMIAYVGVAPLVGDLAARLPRRAFLVTLDLLRAAVALALPFVDQVWQIYVLIALLQSASAAFTPTFQATIPDILTEEEDYTRALSLSRLAYDLENLVSPTLAALLIGLFGFHWLFGGTVIGFLASAALVLSVTLPRASAAPTAEHARRRPGKRHPHLSGDAAPARPARLEPRGGGGRRHGDRQHRGAGARRPWSRRLGRRDRAWRRSAAARWSRRCCCRGCSIGLGDRAGDAAAARPR